MSPQAGLVAMIVLALVAAWLMERYLDQWRKR